MRNCRVNRLEHQYQLRSKDSLQNHKVSHVSMQVFFFHKRKNVLCCGAFKLDNTVVGGSSSDFSGLPSPTTAFTLGISI